MPKGNGCDGGGGICLQNASACDIVFKGKSDFVTKKARESCKFAWEHDLHWNRPVTYTVVQCPESLTKLTGLQPATDDIGNPQPVKSSTTTMEDCCEPSCSHQGNVQWQWHKDVWKKDYDAVYTCNLNGEKYFSSEESPNPCDQAPTPPPTQQPNNNPRPNPQPTPSGPVSGSCKPNPLSNQHATAEQCEACLSDQKYWPCGQLGSDQEAVCTGDGG